MPRESIAKEGLSLRSACAADHGRTLARCTEERKEANVLYIRSRDKRSAAWMPTRRGTNSPADGETPFTALLP
jgi:hypothetical protein